MRAFWEDKVYLVTKQLDEDSTMYEVKSEEKKGKSKVLHRNLLLPSDHLPIPESIVSPKNSRNEKKRTVQHKGEHHHNSLSNEFPEYEDDRDSDNDEIPSFLPVNHPVQPALTINVPADQPQILTPPPTAVPSSPVHLHAEHTDDHVEPPLTPLPMNASTIDNTTPNVVAPNPSDLEHVEEVPTRPQRMRLPPFLFTYDTFRNPMFRPAAVSYIQTCLIYGQLPQFIPYVPPALYIYTLYIYIYILFDFEERV